MSRVAWEEIKDRVRRRRDAAGLPVRSSAEKQAAMDRLLAAAGVHRPAPGGPDGRR
ncbi:hypothetical protein [Streptomyces sp. NPDC059949]|uniref:hypothetical protein n=1 Tax=Streptomyces sp. NPDC059949 TaxID=3347013 RepID=UPI00364A3650